MYCQGNKPPSKRGPRTACAVIWPLWGAIPYYSEWSTFLQMGRPAPAHWTELDWRLCAWVRRAIDDSMHRRAMAEIDARRKR